MVDEDCVKMMMMMPVEVVVEMAAVVILVQLTARNIQICPWTVSCRIGDACPSKNPADA